MSTSFGLASPLAKNNRGGGSSRRRGGVPSEVGFRDTGSYFGQTSQGSVSQGGGNLDIAESLLRDDLTVWEGYCDQVGNGELVKDFIDDEDLLPMLVEKIGGSGIKSRDHGKQLLKVLSTGFKDANRNGQETIGKCDQLIAVLEKIKVTAAGLDESPIGQARHELEFCQWLADADGRPPPLPSRFHSSKLMVFYIDIVKPLEPRLGPLEWAARLPHFPFWKPWRRHSSPAL